VVLVVSASPIVANGPTETETTATTSSTSVAPAPEREVLVLEAVRVLVRATASEVAERSGQPNGSVGVALRALVARGVVAKARTGRGTEYSMVSTGSVRPFKRAKHAEASGTFSSEVAAPTKAITTAMT
jgi:sugar-specific transcriptional regulator TrmB